MSAKEKLCSPLGLIDTQQSFPANASAEIENSNPTSKNNLPYPDYRGNMPSTKALGQPDAAVDRPLEKRCYTVEDLQTILACSRETVYALLAEHHFRWFRLGGQRGPYRISCRSFDEWLDHSME